MNCIETQQVRNFHVFIPVLLQCTQRGSETKMHTKFTLGDTLIDEGFY